MTEKTWGLIDDAIMALTKAVRLLNEKMDRGFLDIVDKKSASNSEALFLW